MAIKKGVRGVNLSFVNRGIAAYLEKNQGHGVAPLAVAAINVDLEGVDVSVVKGWLNDLYGLGSGDQLGAIHDILKAAIAKDLEGMDGPLIDEWIKKLDSHGLHLVFSSGTSGNISFVPRNNYTWDILKGFRSVTFPLRLGKRVFFQSGNIL